MAKKSKEHLQSLPI